MKKAILLRTDRNDQGTFGIFNTNDFKCHSVELPWRDNTKRISCIPVGEYKCELILTNRYGYAYWVRDVPGRSEVLIHGGNWAGDTTRGWRTHSAGCILLGTHRGVAQDQKCVVISQPALRSVRQVMNNEPFLLTVEEVNGLAA